MVGNTVIKEKFMLCTKIYYVPKFVMYQKLPAIIKICVDPIQKYVWVLFQMNE